jgi:hypothetical protein
LTVTFLTLACSSLPLGFRVLLPYVGVSASSLLPLGGLPAAQEAEALGILAIFLVVATWLELAAASLAQADAGTQSGKIRGRTRRIGFGRCMLEMSQGRCFLPTGPPGRLA